jgi:chemotaxis protein MotB
MRPRRRRPVEEPVNHDRWLISYSDLMTLLLAFFVVLFASSYRDRQMLQRLSSSIHLGFQQLGAFSGGADNRGAAYPDLPPDPETYTPPKRSSPLTTPSAATNGDIVELRQQLEAAIGSEIENHEVVMRVTPEGFVISLNELGFFNSGQAALLPGAADKLQKIAKVLGTHGLELRVEGHSDDQPIHTAQFRSNWELSTARAMAVMLLLVDESGFDPSKISVAGYGQFRPVADNSTPEGRRLNRRVDLVVVAKTSPAAAVPPANGQSGK